MVGRSHCLGLAWIHRHQALVPGKRCLVRCWSCAVFSRSREKTIEEVTLMLSVTFDSIKHQRVAATLPVMSSSYVKEQAMVSQTSKTTEPIFCPPDLSRRPFQLTVERAMKA